MYLRTDIDDTICAVATGGGVGGIAVVRVSGPRSQEIVKKHFLFSSPVQSHRIYHGFFRSSLAGDPVDEVLVSYFAEGKSFTGEETVEISCHGGTALTSAILNELVASGARMAQPGEFTFRAFYNDRIDLVQAESVLGLIQSRSMPAARAALRQLGGELSTEFAEIEDELTWILAQLEAEIDFSEEGLDLAEKARLLARTQELHARVGLLLNSYRQGRRLKEGLRVALVGPPNVGKSSLLNAFLREDRAIVTATPGTTRDLVEGQIEIEGLPVTFIDTAGLRETTDPVEKIGIERAQKAAADADLVFIVEDLTDDRAPAEVMAAEFTNVCLLLNKCDLGSRDRLASRGRTFSAGQQFLVSAQTGEGLEGPLGVIRELSKATVSSDAVGAITQARHFEGMQKIQQSLVVALELIHREASPEIIAFELQEAIRTIHLLLGKEYHEQVIDRVFKEFCLGK